jgi:hypothetical protein
MAVPREMPADQSGVLAGLIDLLIEIGGIDQSQYLPFSYMVADTSYTWRRQMRAVASAGYRAFAPDMRGYAQFSSGGSNLVHAAAYGR